MNPLRTFLLNSTLALSACAASAASSGWERLAPLPIPNGGFVGAIRGEQLVVIGGVTWKNDTKIWLDRIWAYEPGSNTWSETGRLPAPLAYSVSGSDGTTVWFAGGSSGETSHRQLWRMQPGEPPKAVASTGRDFVYAAGGLIGHVLYAAGGTDDQARTDRLTNTFLGIDVRTGATTRLADYPETGLTTGTAAVAGGRLYVFGGARWDAARKTVSNLASAHVYTPATNRWEALPPLPHAGRGLSAVALDPHHILVAGGYRNDEVEFVADAWLFDTRKQTFTSTTALPYAAMVTLVPSGPWLYCLGGEDRKRHRTDAVFRIRIQELLSGTR